MPLPHALSSPRQSQSILAYLDSPHRHRDRGLSPQFRVEIPARATFLAEKRSSLPARRAPRVLGSFGGASSFSSSSSGVMAPKLDPSLHLKAFDDGGKLAEGLADHISKLSAASIERKGAFTVVLSGGSLVSALTKLAQAPVVDQIDWSRWHVFWVDERAVRKDDPDSSYKLAHDLFLSKVTIPVSQVYSINDALDADAAADDYQALIAHSIQTGILDTSQQGLPRFDLILLGMGPDGHIASLFPNHPLIQERQRWVCSITDSPKPPPQRITMTLPVINAAANVVFVASGASKAEMVARVFGEELPAGELPAQMILPLDGNLVWYVDRAAAGQYGR
ncbi:probable 6-phosphogluconolactonase 1 [Selaginella moellendorffii]|nr:probable 6-phosphogluconolactonase 1 [Selaginella moellendorffii]|eukprot:XP_002964209.2 probable 6-phosphogluconolactonase 1 [Selaginella moellendorffii]